LQRIIPSAGVEVVEPTDPDTDKLLAQRTKPTANKRSIAAPRKARPVRKSTAADITKLGDQVPAVMKTSPIEGSAPSTALELCSSKTRSCLVIGCLNKYSKYIVYRLR